ncbi:helix-turn-helix transcriptional regulator [Opitutus terrae]|uniref:HTH cro/C1-type domain-containing protein n=1 Tax=Opitutus terrae (strain DSM 11246 / JCM 15787 / PB90-1) TaxID=452637 RepID=B1ZUC1_OPITP|nr:helix-turn-helix transcriptional regulator [Opitutus terrae]ACB76683.1 hypothetical protein Oter_3406 [Opitutus terrae PB90-1]
MLTWSTSVDQSKHASNPKVGKVSKSADLSKSLRKALGGKTQAELAAALLVSRNYISQIEAGLKTPSPRLELQMRRMLTEATSRHADLGGKVEEPAAEYHTDTTEAHTAPTAAQCLRYMVDYLAAAQSIPGMLGSIWVELHRRFPIDEIEQLKRQMEVEGTANGAVQTAINAGRRKAFEEAARLLAEQMSPEKEKTG